MARKLIASKKHKYIYKYKVQSGWKWGYRYKYYDDLGERQELPKFGFDTEKEAYNALVKVQAELLSEGTHRLNSDKITVGDWLNRWLDAYKDEWATTTYQIRDGMIKNYAMPYLGKMKLSKLTVSSYKTKFIQPLLDSGKLDPITVNKYNNLMKIAVNKAVKDGLIRKNPISEVKVKLPKSDDRKAYSSSELQRVLSLIRDQGDDTVYTICLLLAYSGLRIGEAIGLKASDLNFETNELTVERTSDTNGIRAPKTLNSYRTIGIEPFVMDTLQRYIEDTQPIRRGDFIFVNLRSGDTLTYRMLYRPFVRIIDNDEDLKGGRPHTFRHSHATILLQNGATVNAVAKRLGDTPQTISKYYAHVLEEMNKEMVDSFTRAMAQK